MPSLIDVLARLSPEIHQFVKEHKHLMADVSQLTTDLASLQQAVSDDQAAIASVQSYAQAQAAQITNLEQQLSTLQSQGGANLDLSSLESSIAALKQQNQALQAIVPANSSAGTQTAPATGTTAATGTAPAGTQTAASTTTNT
jgi:chromosome segregation ATPase